MAMQNSIFSIILVALFVSVLFLIDSYYKKDREKKDLVSSKKDNVRYIVVAFVYIFLMI